MQSDKTEYHSELLLRIDWSELNLYGHVSNLEFFKYIQASRIHYWEDIGLGDALFREQKIGPILASTSCQFKQQLYFPGMVKILARVDHIGTTSFTLTHLILNEKNEVAGTGKDVIVLFDYNSNTKLHIPSDIRNSIQKKEGRVFDLLKEEK